LPTVDHRRNIVGVVSLPAGHKLAHYEIVEPIGKGGMGEVYRARDTKLDRDVAIKVLPEEFAQDEELSFVIINRRQNCGLVRPEDEEESKIDARETVPPSRRLRT
jgi:serine/threonine protein kinase